MKKEIPFVAVFEDLKELVGEPLPETRFYQRYGTEEEYQSWFDAISEISLWQGLYAPVSVARYVQVSRNAVYKRLKEGRLTGFQFHTVLNPADLGKNKNPETDGLPTCFIPVTECLAWKEIKDGCSAQDLQKYAVSEEQAQMMRQLFKNKGPKDLLDQILNTGGGQSEGS